MTRRAIKLLFFILWELYCVHLEGLPGAFNGFILFGVIAFAWTALFGWEAPSIPEPPEARSEAPAASEGVPAIRGSRTNPDPTRPTHEDYAAMLTNAGKGKN